MWTDVVSYLRKGGLVAAMLVALATSVFAQEGGPKDLTGSWVVTVNSPEIGTFRIGLVCGKDGTVVSLHDPIAFGGIQEGAGFGTWERVDRGQYELTVVWILSNANGEQIGDATYSATVKISDSGDEFTGPERVEFRDKDGNIIFAGSAGFSGSRVKARGRR